MVNGESQSLRWEHLMEKIEAIAKSITKIEQKIEKEHDEIFNRLRSCELECALLKQRVYFISAAISGTVGAVIAIGAKWFGVESPPPP